MALADFVAPDADLGWCEGPPRVGFWASFAVLLSPGLALRCAASGFPLLPQTPGQRVNVGFTLSHAPCFSISCSIFPLLFPVPWSPMGGPAVPRGSHPNPQPSTPAEGSLFSLYLSGKQLI